MLGAILGDMVGSPYEFDHNNYKHKDFPLPGDVGLLVHGGVFQPPLVNEPQHFSKIQCNRDYNPKKKTVLAFAVGLHLSEDETIDLLKSAGYAFSDGSKRDWIVRYCLEQKIYNINQVNTLLFQWDQELLGA